MIGVLANFFTVLLGSAVGLLFHKSIPERVSRAVMTAIGLCTLYIGFSGAMEGQNAIVLILSMALGTALGTLIRIDDGLTKCGKWIERKLGQKGEKNSVAEGFVTASLLFCVGAMTIVGSLNAGLTGDCELLFTKSILDLISSCMLAGTLGVGVMLASLFVLIFQGGLVLCASLLQPLLSDAALVAEITCAGSVMIIGIGLNLIGVTKLKVANMLPALLLVPLFYHLLQLIPV